MIATAAETMATFEHTDAAFAADAPTLAATKPALPLIRASRWCLSSGSRQHDTTDATSERPVFVCGGRKAPPGGADIWGPRKKPERPGPGRGPPRRARRARVAA